MSKSHKGLPADSQAWAAEVDALMVEVRELRGIVKRLTENAGIDMANPRRGVNTGAAPSVKNPVGQKLSSLADVSTYNVLDGQFLGWSQKGQTWLPVNAVGAFPIPEPIAGFPDATGYGYLPSAEGGPYSVLAQNEAFDGDGVFNLTARDSSGDVTSIRSSYYYGLELEHSSQMYFRSGDNADSHTRIEQVASELNLMAFDAEDEIENARLTLTYDFWGLGVEGEDFVCALESTYEDEVLVRANALRLPTTTTATRYTPGATAKGATVFDEDLGINIVWNGTTWTNALGTAV